MEKRLIAILEKHYNELSKLEKPKATQIGGTYYGSTQLLSSVGNHLDFVKNGSHTSYGYGGLNTHYRNAFYLRIGGAYKIDRNAIIKELREITGGVNYVYDTDLGIIDNYGTNFSTIGFGYIVR